MIKVVVWDLDDTIWDGILLEGAGQRLRPQVLEVLRLLDTRGILHSIASRNDHEVAMERLRALGIAEYFLYPQIGWGPKSAAVERIRVAINVGIDAIAFIDDQAFERDEVSHVHPSVRCIDASLVPTLPSLPVFNPIVTEDSARRRHMYLADAERERAAESFDGPADAFLASLGMRCDIARCGVDDLQRAEELTVRTHQLNTTGYTYSYEELDAFRQSPSHLLLVASLEDRYGTYGRIGLALVERGADVWTLKLLLMSCRVMSRGVGTIMLHHVMRLARDHGARFQAEFRHNGRNRMMHVTYRLGGFREVATNDDGLILLEHDLRHIPTNPAYVDVASPS